MSGQRTPWEVDLSDFGIMDNMTTYVAVDDGSETVARVPANRSGWQDRARLIAAAPDLLNELEASAKMLRTLVEVAEDIRLEGAPIIRERLVSVEAAIARARGEQA